MVGKGISDERTAGAKGMRGLGNGELRREAGVRAVEKRIQRWTGRDMLPAQVSSQTQSAVGLCFNGSLLRAPMRVW